MDPLLNFQSQVAIVTGAASGFGRLLCEMLAYRGCKLVVNDIDEAALKRCEKDISEKGGHLVSLAGDIAKEEINKQLVELALSTYGQLDIAVNNAGVAHQPAPLHELTAEVIDKQLNVNLKGLMFGMKYQLPAMVAHGRGHILNVSSLAGLNGAPKGSAYAASKHAVVGLTRTAAVEYGRKNVRVNAICPFFSPTKIMELEGFTSDDARAQLAQGCPMKRLADPQEIVNVMLLMLSPLNTYMNGQAIAVDGGVSAW